LSSGYACEFDQTNASHVKDSAMADDYHKDRIANRRLHPETLMMGYGYAPGLSEGSLKPPIFFLTSTFVFENASKARISLI